MRKFLSALLIFASVCALAVFGGCSKGDKGGEQGSQYAARVDDWTLSRIDLDKAIESLPDHQKQ